MKMNTKQSKTYGTDQRQYSEGIHSDTGQTKKDRNISNKQPNPTSTRTGGTTTNKAQSEQKAGNNQDQSRIKWHRD